MAWVILNITYAGTRSLIKSGMPLTIRSNGLAIVNNSSVNQTILNNITLGADQIWKAAAGPLTFGGSIANGGFTLTIDGTNDLTFSVGSGLTGLGGLTKSGAGILRVNAPLTFTGPLTLNAGKLQLNSDN